MSREDEYDFLFKGKWPAPSRPFTPWRWWTDVRHVAFLWTFMLIFVFSGAYWGFRRRYGSFVVVCFQMMAWGDRRLTLMARQIQPVEPIYSKRV